MWRGPLGRAFWALRAATKFASDSECHGLVHAGQVLKKIRTLLFPHPCAFFLADRPIELTRTFPEGQRRTNFRDAEMTIKIIFERSSQKGGRQGGSNRGSTGDPP